MAQRIAGELSEGAQRFLATRIGKEVPPVVPAPCEPSPEGLLRKVNEPGISERPTWVVQSSLTPQERRAERRAAAKRRAESEIGCPKPTKGQRSKKYKRSKKGKRKADASVDGFPSKYPGTCVECILPFGKGERIKRDRIMEGWVHTHCPPH